MGREHALLRERKKTRDVQPSRLTHQPAVPSATINIGDRVQFDEPRNGPGRLLWERSNSNAYMGKEHSLGSLSRPHLVLIRGQVATTKGGFVGANIFGCITRYLLYPGLRRCPKPSPTNHLTNKQCLFYSSSRSSAVVVVHSRPSSVHPFPSLCIAALSGRDKP